MSTIRALVLALAGLALAAPAPTFAGPGSGGGGGGNQQVKVEGILTGGNAAAGQVVITTAGGANLTILVGPTTRVERNGVRVPLAAFQLGDRVQAVTNLAGQASKIEAVGP